MATKKGLLILALMLASVYGSILGMPPAHAAIYSITRTHSKLGTWTTTAGQQAGTLSWTPQEGYSLICVILAKGSADTPTGVSITQSGVSWVVAAQNTYASNYQYEGIWLGTITGAVSTSYTISATNSDGISSSFLEYDCVLATDQAVSTAWDSSSPFVSGTTPTVTTNQQVFISGMGCYGSTAPPPTSILNSYTLVDYTDNGLYVNCVLEKITAYDTTPAATSTGFTYASMGCLADIATFKITSVPVHYTYNLQSIYEDGTTLASLAVSVADTASSFSVTITSTASNYYFTYPITSISWVSGSYQRVIYPLATGETYKIAVQQGGATSRVHLWTIRDLVGAATGGYLETRRVISGTEYVIERNAIIDTINGIPTVMIDGGIYHVYVVEDDKATYHEFGYYLATSSNTEPILTLANLAFDQEIQFVTTYLPILISRSVDRTTIDIVWLNHLEPTYNITSIDYVIKSRSGATLDSDISYDQSGWMTYGGLTNTTDVLVYVTVSGGYFGNVTKVTAFEGFDNFSAVPDIGDLGFSFGGIGTSNLIGVVALIFIAGLFTAANAAAGAVVTVLAAAMLSRMGFLSVTDTILGTALCLAIIFAISRRGGNA